MSKGGQHVGTPASPVGSISRLKQEIWDLKAEVERLKDRIAADNVMLGLLRELQVAAEAVEGPVRYFPLSIRPQIRALHKAIRKVKGMEY